MTRRQFHIKPRRASSSRLTVLLLFLVVVGAGCIYEFAFARPSYQKAWDQIRKIDKSPTSSEYTASNIEELMDRAPHRVDDTLHEDCIVHTFRWRSGLLVKNHDIHVVFTKLNDALIEKRPELKNELYYYSASAGQPLDMVSNFPVEKKTIVQNLNPPNMGLAGTAPPQNQTDDDESGDDESGDDESKDEKADDAGSDKKEEATDEKADDTDSDKKEEAADKKADDTDSDKKEEASDEKGTDEKSDDEESDG